MLPHLTRATRRECNLGHTTPGRRCQSGHLLICAKVMVESTLPPASGRRRARRIGRLGLALVLLAASASIARAAVPAAPLLDGMGPDRGPVASRIPLAQRYFHQGMALTWGFNPAEAARSFAAAAAIDPRCALCYWGLAWASGPNINADMTADDAARVRGALARARGWPPWRRAAIAS